MKYHPKWKENDKWERGQSRGNRYIFTGNQEKGKRGDTEWLFEVRERLDTWPADKVTFDPYKEDRELCLNTRKRLRPNFYNGPLFHPFGYTMYNPTRVRRQLGFQQETPEETDEPANFKVVRSNCSSGEKHIDVAYEPEPQNDHWNNRHTMEVYTAFWDAAELGYEMSDGYMDWYNRFTHSRVIRTEVIAQTRGQKSKQSPHSESTLYQTFVSILTLCVLFKIPPTQSLNLLSCLMIIERTFEEASEAAVL